MRILEDIALVLIEHTVYARDALLFGYSCIMLSYAGDRTLSYRLPFPKLFDKWGKLYIITAYRPAIEKWEAGGSKRKGGNT